MFTTTQRENALLTAYLTERRPLAALAKQFDLALEAFLAWLSTPRVQNIIESVRRLEEQRAAASAALTLHQIAVAEDSTPAQALRACATLVRLLNPRTARRPDAERPQPRVACSIAPVEHVPSDASHSATRSERAHAPHPAAPAEHVPSTKVIPIGSESAAAREATNLTHAPPALQRSA